MTTECAYCGHPSYEHYSKREGGETRWQCASLCRNAICNCRRFQPQEVKP